MNYLELAFAAYCVGLVASASVVDIVAKSERTEAFALAWIWPITVALVVVGNALGFVMAYARRYKK